MCAVKQTEIQLRQEAVLAKALKNIKDFWDLSGIELAEIVGVDNSVISRLDTTPVFHPDKKQGQLALMLVRVYRSLGAFLGDRVSLQKDWLRAHHQVFNQAPLEAMKSPEGLAHVVMYLDAMRGAEG